MKPHGDRLAHFANPAVLNERFVPTEVCQDAQHAVPSAASSLKRSTRSAAGASSANALSSIAVTSSFVKRLAARFSATASTAAYVYVSAAASLGGMAAPLSLAGLGAAPALSASVATTAAFTTMAVLATLPRQAQAQANKTFRDETPDADTAIANQSWERAIADLDKRIASNPRDVQARFKRATALARLGRDDEAIKAFIQITQTYPELPEPYNNLAALYAKHGRYQEARATLETALSANPNFALARRNLGDIYLRLAAASYQQAAKQDPADRLAIAREKAIESIITNAPANSASLTARRAPIVTPARRTTAEPVNKHGFVPSMGNQPPIILPETETGSAAQN